MGTHSSRWDQVQRCHLPEIPADSPQPTAMAARFLRALGQLSSAPAAFQKAIQQDLFGAATAQGHLLVESREAFYPIKVPLQPPFQIKK